MYRVFGDVMSASQGRWQSILTNLSKYCGRPRPSVSSQQRFSCGRHEFADCSELGLLGWLAELGWKVGKESAGAHVFNNAAVTMHEGATMHVLKRYAAFEEHTSRLRNGLPICCFSRVFIIFLPSKEFNNSRLANVNHHSVLLSTTPSGHIYLSTLCSASPAPPSTCPTSAAAKGAPHPMSTHLLINLKTATIVLTCARALASRTWWEWSWAREWVFLAIA